MGRNLPFLYIMSVHLENFYGRIEEEQLVKIYKQDESEKDKEGWHGRHHRKVLSRNRFWAIMSRAADIKAKCYSLPTTRTFLTLEKRISTLR